VPPPRVHRHRYYGVLAPNSPLRAAVTAMAMPPAMAAPVAPSLSDRFLGFLWPLQADRDVGSGSIAVPMARSHVLVIAFVYALRVDGPCRPRAGHGIQSSAIPVAMNDWANDLKTACNTHHIASVLRP